MQDLAYEKILIVFLVKILESSCQEITKKLTKSSQDLIFEDIIVGIQFVQKQKYSTDMHDKWKPKM